MFPTLCLPRKQIFGVFLLATAVFVFLSVRYVEIYGQLYQRTTKVLTKTSEPLETPTKKLLYGALELETPVKSLYTGWANQTWASYELKQSDSGLNSCVTPDELRVKFKRCYESSEKRNKQCKAVHTNPDSYWRSQYPTQRQSHSEDFKRMVLASQCCAFNYGDLVLNKPRDPPFPWELDYLCGSGPLLNMADTAHASKSTVRLLGVTRDGKRREGMERFTVGDHVSLEVVVRNGRGQVQKLGGDSVRLWLVSPEQGASVTADVTDLRNGSYLAKSILPWAGAVQVQATIAHTRDLFRTVMFIQRYFSTSHWFTALWQKGAYTEATPCSPYPALPAFSAKEICNVTHKNGGFPWFCGKPIKKELSCSDYASARKIDYPSYYPLTAAEEELIELTESKRPFLIPNKIGFDVQSEPGTQQFTLPTPHLPCNQRDLTQTFTETDQSGYLFGREWRPFACQLPNVTSEFLKQCLKDTTLLYIGDSNTRAQMDILTPLVKCKHKIDRARVNWHAPLWCDNNSLNSSIKYFPPMHPFYGSIGEQVKPEVLSSAVEKMDAIPATGKYIVHLHNYLHFAPFHLGLAEQRIRLLRAAAKRLLARNPHVIVVYQSAHTAYTHSPKNKHKLNALLVELQQTIMSGLGSRAMFVRTFPITVAAENEDCHPKVANLFTKLYMGHICGR